ncbi:type VI secretion system tip protein VgrG [Vibrio parahaemolyticus]|nr:type VI secretion system tip protein VgrG [Vibrio parahaemolyticus]
MSASLMFTISIDGLDDNSLVVRDFDGYESLSHDATLFSHCHGFHYDIGLASRRSDLTALDVIDQFAELQIFRDGDCVQRVHGVVQRFTREGTGHHHSHYALTLVPAVMRLSLHHDRRIFQQQTVAEIISVLLQEAGVQDYAFALTRDVLPREFCMQYRETNLAFIERLAAEEGLVYHHEHIAGKHTIVFSDNSVVMPQLPDPITYNNQAGGVAESTFISAFEVSTERGVADVTLHDRSFKKPAYRFAQHVQGNHLDYQRSDYSYFDFPGRYKDDENGKAFSQIRLDYLRRETQMVNGKSNEPLLRPGYRFSLADHPDEACNRAWTIVSVHHQGKQPQALEEAGGSGATTYHNTFALIPSNHTWRATLTTKPQALGPEVAVVVGPEGEEIHCDKYGRVRIQFPWDRYSANDDSASCWIRVAQGLAGPQYGIMALPRVGDEVVVSFLNGDPDQPIVTGRTYHETNVPPYPLPENKTKTVLRSKTHQGKGFNELSFEDQAGKEKLYLHAQKDMETEVLNDQVVNVKRDLHTTVDNERFTHVKQDEHHTVDGHVHQHVKKDHSLNVDGSMHHKANGRYAMEAKDEVHLKAGQKVVIEASSELTLKVGGSFIKVDASGVSLVGAGINLNSGGSAGSGQGFAGQLPSLPLGIESLQPPDNILPVQMTLPSLISTAINNVPMAPMCGRLVDGQCTREDCTCDL